MCGSTSKMDAASSLDSRPSSGGDLGADLEKVLSKLRPAELADVCSVYVKRNTGADSVEQSIAFRLQVPCTCHSHRVYEAAFAL